MYDTQGYDPATARGARTGWKNQFLSIGLGGGTRRIKATREGAGSMGGRLSSGEKKKILWVIG